MAEGGGRSPGNPTLGEQPWEPYIGAPPRARFGTIPLGATLGTLPWRPSQGKVWNPTRAEGCKRDKQKLIIC